jgi:hypothetical protein
MLKQHPALDALHTAAVGFCADGACFALRAVNWDCKLASWSEQCNNAPNICASLSIQ